jgi:hypothetical protein
MCHIMRPLLRTKCSTPSSSTRSVILIQGEVDITVVVSERVVLAVVAVVVVIDVVCEVPRAC